MGTCGLQAKGEWSLEKTSTLRQVGGGPLRPGGLSLTEEALAACDFAPGSRVLDAGCGTGDTLRHLNSMHSLTVFGIDRSQSLLAAARHQASELSLTRGTLEELPYANQSFDGIFCECTLSHTREAQVLTEFARVLRPQGHLVLTDLYHRLPSGELTNAPPTKHEISALLAAADFQLSLWQDRSRDLKRLAVELVMSSGTCADNLCSWAPKTSVFHQTSHNDLKSIGYYLLVARKLNNEQKDAR